MIGTLGNTYYRGSGLQETRTKYHDARDSVFRLMKGFGTEELGVGFEGREARALPSKTGSTLVGAWRETDARWAATPWATHWATVSWRILHLQRISGKCLELVVILTSPIK